MAISNLTRRWLQAGSAAILASSLAVQGAAASAAAPSAGEDAGFNGEPGQWSGIPSASVELAQTLEEMKAVQQDGKLKLLVRGPGLDRKGIWYVDADGDEKTGLPAPYWANGGGIDLKISQGVVWKATGGKWVRAGTAETKTAGDVMEAEADLDALGFGGGSVAMRAAFMLEGDQYLPAPGKTMLVVPPPAGSAFGPDVQVTVDAEADDWSSVEPAARSADGKTTLYAAEEGSSLVLLVTGKLAEFNDIYLDTDRSGDTGYGDVGWPSFGGDWLVENGGLYQSTGAGWNWGPADGTGIEYKQAGSGDSSTAEYRIPLSLIGLAAPKPIAVGFTSSGVTVPAADVRPPLVAPSLPKLTADGDPSEWASLPVTAEGSGKVKLLKAFADEKVLSVMAGAESFDQETNLFIDSDNDADTGYNGWEYKRTGADYLAQNGKLYRYTGPGWAWEELGPAEWKVSGQADAEGLKSLEVRADLSAYPNAGASMRVAIGVGSDYAPAVDSEGEYALATGRGGAPVKIDGQADDWDNIDAAAKGTGEKVKLSAAQTADKIYLLAEGSVDTRNVFFLDTDASAKTGFKKTDWTGTGADAKIEYNQLYLFDDKTGKWKEAGPVRAEVQEGRALFYFYRDQLGLKKTGTLSVGYVGRGAYRLPAAGQGPLVLKSSVPAASGSAFVPRETFGVLDNPLMGWVGWSGRGSEESKLAQPHKLVYANISWQALEPEKGKFDWAGIEKEFQFAKWKAEGTRIVLRFVLDDPGDPDMDIPQWLYDELVQAEGEDGAGKWYDTPDTVVGKGFAPNYASPTLIAEHERVLTELGKRYDADPFVAFIEIGSLGHWGEFHNWPEEVSGAFPKLAVSDQYVEQYLHAFPHKLIGMRKPFPIAADNRLGLFNDVFGSKGSTDEWVNWTKEGWNEIGSYVNEGQDPEAVQNASKMPDFWKYNFSGGEFYNGDPLLSLTDDTIMETLRQTRASHTSWLGPSSPAPFVLGKDIDEEVQANIDLVLGTMGYRFVLESVSHDGKSRPGSSLSVRMTWNNKGVAPFYEEWPLALALIDSRGKLVKGSVQSVDGADLPDWLPGRQELKASYKLPAGLAAGNYRLAVAILDPATGKPGMHLAVEGERSDGWTTLDRLQIVK
ncbi:DUF4832 domain-containing protein [Cohnella zeiphila]|uniref:DUF4832 domain-containing protein n=1 Tax=Cohnella zeiphila TaxID=2761120 RepID=A0A7X0SSF7_9BACL|nr:DUF4832 domain-containing protein [Cohnella zeiphila]MBB6735282.1 DUF4832 domain-containing protein [Cohnella zeiphila]